jgi:GNAT superfamily N-acetyltransferase
MITVRAFKPEEWPQYRNVRLRALKESPHAFGSTFEDAVKYPDETWKNRLQDLSIESDLALAAFDGDEAMGLAWGRIDPETLERADLYQMWGSPDIRGQGIGRKLLYGVIEWARQQGAGYVILGVTIGNEPAEQLYRTAGFSPVGEPEPLRENSPKLIQNMKLVL